MSDRTSKAITVLTEAIAEGDEGRLARSLFRLTWHMLLSGRTNPERPWMLTFMSIGYQALYERGGKAAHLHQAVQLGEDALAWFPPGHPGRDVFLARLGGVLNDRFERLNDVADLDRAMALLGEAYAATTSDTSVRVGVLMNYAGSFRHRHLTEGDYTDFERAIELDRAAHALCGTEAPEYPALLANLAAALRLRHEADHNGADLDEAIELYRHALDLGPPEARHRITFRSGLGLMLRLRHAHSGARADIDEAVRIGVEAVEACAADEHDGAMARTNAALSYLARYDHTRIRAEADPADLTSAVRLGQEALAATPADHPTWAGRASNLGNSHWTRFQVGGNPRDGTAAVGLWRQAASHDVGRLRTRLLAATAWADASMDLGLPDLNAFRQAVELLLAATTPRLRPEDQLRILESQSLGTDAAACALAVGEPGSGVELADQGRSVRWTHVLNTRPDLDRLHAAFPVLAERVARLGRRMMAAEGSD